MKRLLVILILLFSFSAAAQDNWGQEGDLDDTQVIIEKDRKIDLPRVNRDFKKVPKIKSSQSPVEVDFSSKQFLPNLSPLSPRIRVLTIQDEKLEKLYANQVKIGGGNYGASYFEGNFASKRSRDKSYGLNVFHQSFANGVIDDRNSGSGYQIVNPYGKFIFNKAVLDVEAVYERHNNYLYGYDTTAYNEVQRDSLQRTFHTIGTRISLSEQNENANYHYNLEADASQLFTNYNNSEFSFLYDWKNTFDLNEDFSLYLNSNGFISILAFESIDSSQNRNLLRFQAGVRFNRNNFKVGLGLNIVHENDTLEQMNRTHFFPDLNIKYTIFDRLSAFAGIKGDVRAILYRDLLLENPYLDNTISVNNTLMPFKFYGGLQGSLNNYLAYETGFSLASVRHNFGYEAVLRETEGEIRYRPIYFDQNNTEANVYVSASIQTQKFKSNLRGDYFYFNLGENQLMPFRPNFQLSYEAAYWFAEKLKIGFNSHLQGRMNNVNTIIGANANYSFDLDESIPPIYDLGIKLGYQLNDRSQIFLHANNLIANKYEFYLGYPNRGFQILGGFTYSF